MRESIRYLAALTMVAVVASVSGIAGAQITPGTRVLPAPSAAGLTDLNNVILYRSALSGAQAFDGSLDAAAYTIGPGDQFEINLWSPSARNYSLTVTPEGTLLMPVVGELHVAGHSLDSARQLITAAVRRSFPGHEIGATLVQTRRVRVYVSGQVTTPGSYELFASQRLADALALADDILAGSGSARNVIRTTTAGAQTYDLLTFYARGDQSQNPYLQGGEHIRVQPREPREDQLQIAGAVLHPGFIEYRPGDRVSDLIRFAYGFQPRADLSKIVVTRTDADTGRPKTFYVSAAHNGEDWAVDDDMLLQRGDHVFVSFLPAAARIAIVAIYGEITRPGHYAVVEDTTTLSGLIQASGGLTARASPHETSFLRPAYKSHLGGDPVPPLISTSLQGLLAGDLSFDVPLKNGDSIFIPPQSLGVQVLGRVRRPGILPYIPNQTVKEYIQRAGGYAVEANKGSVRMVRAVSGAIEKPNDDHLPKPGDQIIIPARTGASTWQKLRQVLTVVGAAATTYLVIEKITE